MSVGVDDGVRVSVGVEVEVGVLVAVARWDARIGLSEFLSMLQRIIETIIPIIATKTAHFCQLISELLCCVITSLYPKQQLR